MTTVSTSRPIYETEDYLVELQYILDPREVDGKALIYAIVNKRTGVTEARAQTEGISRRAVREFQQELNMELSGQTPSPLMSDTGLPGFTL